MKAEVSVTINWTLALVGIGAALFYYFKMPKRRNKFTISEIDKLLGAAPKIDTALRIYAKSNWVKLGLMEDDYLPGEDLFSVTGSRFNDSRRNER
jgi:hypothetical protein